MSKKRNEKLALSPNKNARQSKKTNALTSGKASMDDIKKSRGILSYSTKAINMGIYEDIAYSIQMYREINPDSSYVDVYKNVLYEKYSTLFTTPPDRVYSGNISKIINGDCLWQKAYFSSTSKLVSKALLKIGDMLDKDDLDDSVLVNAFDKLKKYEIANRQLNSSIQTDDDDIPNFGYSSESEVQ